MEPEPLRMLEQRGFILSSLGIYLPSVDGEDHRVTVGIEDSRGSYGMNVAVAIPKPRRIGVLNNLDVGVYPDALSWCLPRINELKRLKEWAVVFDYWGSGRKDYPSSLILSHLPLDSLNTVLGRSCLHLHRFYLLLRNGKLRFDFPCCFNGVDMSASFSSSSIFPTCFQGRCIRSFFTPRLSLTSVRPEAA